MEARVGSSGSGTSGGALFREIHKNAWLRRLNGDGKRPSVLAKKPDRYWVVFCVHDDCEAFLEGYSDPRQAPSHSPEWSLSLQTVKHISHALVSVEQEFEFVITLASEVARFNANTWECMQEWVESLRSKLREMKLLSPKENLYSKLPESKPPLAPTRDPTSPLPATPPVPAAIVPGIERVQPSISVLHQPQLSASATTSTITSSTVTSSTPSTSAALTGSATCSAQASPFTTAMSNTSTQNLMNLLTNPLQAVSSINNQQISSQHLFDAISLESDLSDSAGSLDECSTDVSKRFILDNSATPVPTPSTANNGSDVISQFFGGLASNLPKSQKTNDGSGFSHHQHRQHQDLSGASGSSSASLATTFANNVLADPGTASLKRNSTNNDRKVSVDVQAGDSSESDEGADASTGSSSNYGYSSPRSRGSTGSHMELFLCVAGEESSIESSSLSPLTMATVGASQNDSAQPITTTSAATHSKARNRHCLHFKKNRSNSPQNSIESSSNVTIIEVSNGTTNANISSVKTTLVASPKEQHDTLNSVGFDGKVSTINNNDPVEDLADDNYKSNVQIIPSNIEYDHYHPSRPDCQITTVKVPNIVDESSGSNPSNGGEASNVIITAPIQPTVIAAVATSSTPIKTDGNNFGTITQIAVNSCDTSRTTSHHHQHYEQVFLTPSSPIQVISNSFDQPTNLQSLPILSKSTDITAKLNKSKITLLCKQSRSSSQSDIQLNRAKNHRNGQNNKENRTDASGAAANSQSAAKTGILPSVSNSAASSTHASPSKRAVVDKNIYTPQPQRPILQRGLTEMVISRSTNAVVISGRDHPVRGRQPTVAVNQSMDNFRNEVNEQRRRSSSTSDAQPESSGNAAMRVRLNVAAPSQLQLPPQPFRPHHQITNQQDALNSSGSNRKLTLREQQVMQLRREMMHPGGVRLQLRRKDCINSIGLVDAFGAVWVAGWKQKEHPVLYNALHIGDQLISVAGVAIISAAEAHKVIRGAPGLFVELIIRRVPFGRVYAIRRELDGQCLGLIRDGNTATIVDVVPNSLAARHGLPPKAKSCDGFSLTFWVLTEINGRPLNLFFKDTEIRDRLNAVGRDISILVQPADLVTKLKKQLKTLRGHKDFIVQ